MRIVSLLENRATVDKLFTEHSVCFYIEHAGKIILFGAGASHKVIENAIRLSLPLNKAESCIIPHNHSSCSLGAEALLKDNPSLRFFVKASAATDCYEKNGVFKTRTGLPSSFFHSGKHNVVMFSKFTEVCKDFYLVSNEFENDENIDKCYYIKKDGRTVKDNFEQECFAVVFPGVRKKGCVIITACSHCGITNIIRTVQKLWNCPIISVVGGFSLQGMNSKNKMTNDSISSLAKEIQNFGTGAIYTCHCTGEKGYELLKDVLGDQIQYFHTGEELVF